MRRKQDTSASVTVRSIGSKFRSCSASAIMLFAYALGLHASPLQEFAVNAKKMETHAIGNRFKDISVWHYNGTTADEKMFHEWAEAMPAGWLKREYPWLKEIQVFIASGGAYKGHPRQDWDKEGTELTRDLFVDPSNLGL